ncbi:unnamed protein product [Ranitomeya imitator]|uniref:MICOS complex subunit MIC60 n=1 Tax=Ranitomeya imitator TaxID=111125 RepID=A0ABN9LD45_9NEOB|nr:unnamed protein product [Ranitomeya imitator]
MTRLGYVHICVVRRCVGDATHKANKNAPKRTQKRCVLRRVVFCRNLDARKMQLVAPSAGKIVAAGLLFAGGGVGGTVLYAKWDPKFRDSVEKSVPYSDKLFDLVLGAAPYNVPVPKKPIPEAFINSLPGSLLKTPIMGKTSDLTDVKKAIIDTLKQEGKTQKEISQQIGCSQSAVSRHLNGKSVGRKQCGRKRCTTRRGDRTLRKIVEKDRFQTLGNLRKQWTESGVETSRATVHRRVQEMGYRCRIPQVKASGPLKISSVSEVMKESKQPKKESIEAASAPGENAETSSHVAQIISATGDAVSVPASAVHEEEGPKVSEAGDHKAKHPAGAEQCKECDHEQSPHLKERPAEEVAARLVQQEKEEKEKIECKSQS